PTSTWPGAGTARTAATYRAAAAELGSAPVTSEYHAPPDGPVKGPATEIVPGTAVRAFLYSSERRVVTCPGTTAVTGEVAACGNAARTVSAATWGAAPRGSTRSSAMPTLACANGSASVTRSPATTMPVPAGLRMTQDARRQNTPRSVLRPGSLRRT